MTTAYVQQLLAAAQAQAAVSVDMNEATAGGGGKEIPAGRYFGRIVEYIDCGNQPQSFQGKKKEPAPEFRLGIAVWGEGISEPDGTPYIDRPFKMAVKRNEKAKTYLAFKALNYKNDPKITHFAQFLGEAFIFTYEDAVTKQGKPYTRINLEKTLPARDVMSGQPYQVPEVADALYNLFLWDFPSLEAWDKLFIEGTNDEGKSKNWLQETILGATNFSGSPLHQLMLQAGRQVVIPEKQPEPAAAAPAQPAQAPAVASPNVAPAQVPTGVAAPLAQPQVQPVAAPAAVTVPGVPVPSAGAQTAPAPVATIPSVPGTAATSPSSPA